MSVLQVIYSTVLYVLVMFLVPLVLLVILNYKLMTALQKTRRKRDTLRSATTSHRFNNRQSSGRNGESAPAGAKYSNSRSEDDITRMLIVVVLVFVVTQSPALVTQALYALMADDNTVSESCPHPFYFFYVRLSDLLVVANSSLNFIVYSFCSRRFRQILFSLVKLPCADNSTLASIDRNRGQTTTRRCTVVETNGQPAVGEVPARALKTAVETIDVANEQQPPAKVGSIVERDNGDTRVVDETTLMLNECSSPLDTNDIQ